MAATETSTFEMCRADTLNFGLVILFSMNLSMVLPTHVTMNDTAMLDRSIDAVCRPLTEERKVREYVM